MKRLDFINKRLGQKNETRASIRSVDETMLEHYQAFVKRKKPCIMNLSYQILTTHWRFGRMWSRYLLHLIQVWPRMLCTSTLTAR